MEYRLTNSNIGNLPAESLYNYSIRNEKSVFAKFLDWCEGQQSNNFLWLALSFFGQIGLTLPVTAFCIVFLAHHNFLLWIIISAVNVPVLVLNLAAFPTKTTLPFVFFAWLTQAVVILYCIGFAVMH